MADPTPSSGAAPLNPNAMSVEIAESAPQASSVNTVRRASGTSKGEQSTSERLKGGSVTVGGDDRDVPRDATGASETTPSETAVVDVQADGEVAAGDGPKDEAAPLPDLGEFNPEDPEVAAKFDERYYTEDAKLNTAALEKEWFGSVKKDGDVPTLNPATYAYLEHRLGLSKDIVDGYAEGLQLKAEKVQSAFFEGAGGKDRYTSAIEWAKTGGYTEAQQRRYNEQLTKGGQDAEDARDALMGRFGKVRTPKGDQQPRRGPAGAPPERNPANAKRDAARGGAGGGGGGAQGFATKEEYTKAFRETPRGDNKAQAALRARLAASPEHVRRG